MMPRSPHSWARQRIARRLVLPLPALVLCLTVWGCALGAGGQAGAKVGVVDPVRVLKETTAGKKAEESLTSFVKNRQAVIELEEKELKRMEEDLMRQASVLTGNAKKEREQQFQRRVMEFQQKGNELNREIQEKQKEVMEGFREKVERVVAKVAQQQGVQMVLEKTKGGMTLYSDASLDITGKVVEELNKGTP